MIFKKALFLSFLFSLYLTGYGQNNPYSSKYSTTSLELIVSFSNAKINNTSVNTVPRFTALNVEQYFHTDFSRTIGFFTGAAIRNIGLIIQNNDSVTTKLRTYTLGLPLAIKIGNLQDESYMFFGAEAELPFHFKQKSELGFFQEWFSNRTQRVWPSAFIGYHFSGGMTVRFKYYLTDFYNTSYAETVNGVVTYPYENTHSQVYYISVGWFIKNKNSIFSKRNNITPPVHPD